MELRFILVSHCNFDCYFCLNEYFGSKEAKYSLTGSDFRKITKMASDQFGINKITLTGGEPTLRKDLNEIIESIAHPSINLTLVSNGTLLDRHIEILKHLDELHVSFHSFDKDHWERITNSNGKNMKIVKDNIILVRKKYPNLKIKLNVVAERGNSTESQINQYLAFAKEYNLEISLFRDGSKYIDSSRVDGTIDYNNRADWWDLTNLNVYKHHKSQRKEIWISDGISINLSYTSTDFQTWDSIWVSPNGDIYGDIFQKSPVLNIKSSLLKADLRSLKKAFSSLVLEAKVNLLIQNVNTEIEREGLKSKLVKIMKKRIRLNLTVIPKPIVR